MIPELPNASNQRLQVRPIPTARLSLPQTFCLALSTAPLHLTPLRTRSVSPSRPLGSHLAPMCRQCRASSLRRLPRPHPASACLAPRPTLPPLASPSAATCLRSPRPAQQPASARLAQRSNLPPLASPRAAPCLRSPRPAQHPASARLAPRSNLQRSTAEHAATRPTPPTQPPMRLASSVAGPLLLPAHILLFAAGRKILLRRRRLRRWWLRRSLLRIRRRRPRLPGGGGAAACPVWEGQLLGCRRAGGRVTAACHTPRVGSATRLPLH